MRFDYNKRDQFENVYRWELKGLALPLVRKTFSSIASSNFISVQPMNLPSGILYHFDTTYKIRKKNIR